MQRVVLLPGDGIGPEPTLAACLQAEAVLMGAVGAPDYRWTSTNPDAV